MRFALLLLLLLPVLLAQSAHADFGITTGVDLGIWKSTFKQEGFSRTATVQTGLSPAINPYFGFLLGQNFFVEYSPYLYLSRLGSSYDGTFGAGDASDVVALSLVSFNAGLRFPDFPLEGYARLARSKYDFASGSDNDFHGYVLGLGVAYRFEMNRVLNLKFKLEYQRHHFTTDDSGTIPSSISTGANLYVLTVGFNFGKMFGQKREEQAPPQPRAVQPEEPKQVEDQR